MKICSVCGWLIAIDEKTGCLLTHGPESMVNWSPICSGSGMQVELPKVEKVDPS